MAKRVIIVVLAIVGVVAYGLFCGVNACEHCSPGDTQEITNTNTNQNVNANVNANLNVNANYNPVNVDVQVNNVTPVPRDIDRETVTTVFKSPRQFHIPQINVYPTGPERADEAKSKGTVSPIKSFVGIYNIDEIVNMATVNGLWAEAEVVPSMKVKPSSNPLVDSIGAYDPNDETLPRNGLVILGELYVRASGDDVLNRQLFARLLYEATKYGATGVFTDSTDKWDDMSSWSIGLGGNGSIAKMTTKDESFVGGGGTGVSYAQGNYKERAWVKCRVFGYE